MKIDGLHAQRFAVGRSVAYSRVKVCAVREQRHPARPLDGYALPPQTNRR